MYDATGVYYDPILTNFSVGYQPAEAVGTRILPVVPVSLPTGKYRVFDRSNWLVFDDHRAPGTVANEVIGRIWSEDTFQVEEHSLQSPVTDEERQNVGVNAGNPANAALFAGIQPEQDAVALITRSILLGLENKIATLVRATTSYAGGHSTTLSGTGQWSDYTGTSDPIKDIEAAIRVVYSKIYRRPNRMLIPWIVWSWLRNHPKIVDRVKSFQLTTEGAFRELTGFEGEIIIAENVYNTADNVDAAQSVVEIWGKDVILAVVDDTPSMNSQTLGKTFSQTYPNGQLRPVERWREEPRKSDLFRASQKYDLKITSNVAGYVIKAAVA